MTQEDNLPPLTVQDQTLIEALAEGASNSEAYRRAYGANGYSAASLRVRACVKIGTPLIQQHLRALRAIGLNNAAITLESRIEEERAFAQRCENAKQYAAAGSTYDRINKLCGYYVERIDVTVHDPAAMLHEMATISPEYAMLAAAWANLDWRPPKQIEPETIDAE